MRWMMMAAALALAGCDAARPLDDSGAAWTCPPSETYWRIARQCGGRTAPWADGRMRLDMAGCTGSLALGEVGDELTWELSFHTAAPGGTVHATLQGDLDGGGVPDRWTGRWYISAPDPSAPELLTLHLDAPGAMPSYLCDSSELEALVLAASPPPPQG